MRRSICELTKPSARRELRLAGISTSTTADVHIRVLTAAPRIKPTSTRCHSAWQPKPGRASTYRRGDFVQTSGTSSSCGAMGSLAYGRGLEKWHGGPRVNHTYQP